MLLLLTLLHFAVDGLCGAALAAHAQTVIAYDDILRLYALYNLIAFGAQWLAGLILDLKPCWLKRTFPLSLLLLALAMLPDTDWLSQAILLGLGNCLFHVAAGSLVLRESQNFTEPGLFVASGAIGLALGLHAFVPPWPFLLLCALGTAGVLWMKAHQPASQSWPKTRLEQSPLTFPLCLCLLLLLGCVTLRGFGGGHAASWVLLFPCTYTLGKALGGVICDAIGYRKCLLAIFLLSFFALQLEGLASKLILVFALNMSMPLTLRLAHFCCPAYPGLIFGLTATCLLPGACFGNLMTLPAQVSIVCVFLSLFAAGALLTRFGKKNLEKS
ncbi:MAG: hypothetical protein K6G15_04295 [Desulfovibrio sp.]|nr:hypothetical protein [Desulfovibrio sp.]